MDRRMFSRSIISVAVAPMLGGVAAADDELERVVLKAAVRYEGRLIPPIYAVAYVDPRIPAQQGQEKTVAKFPLVVVPQNTATPFVRWRNEVRTINPDAVMLGYQMVALESFNQGPGDDVMRTVRDAWLKSPSGGEVRVEARQRRVFDLRKDDWKTAFLEACAVTLKSYPYQGLFLDQCHVFQAHSLNEAVRREMRPHLAEVLQELRRRHPSALIVGNGRESWPGLNGKMSEGQPRLFARELRPFPGQAHPGLNLGLVLLNASAPHNEALVRRQLVSTCSLEAFFAAAINYQTMSWFSVYDDVIRICRSR
jgi:hypothetical protein